MKCFVTITVEVTAETQSAATVEVERRITRDHMDRLQDPFHILVKSFKVSDKA